MIEIKKIHDNRIKIIKLRNKKGGNYARNKGIRIATGEFIAFLDSDDIFYHDKLEKQINNLKSKKADFDFCKIYIHINITYSINFILPNRSQEQSIINGDKQHFTLSLYHLKYILKDKLSDGFLHFV